MTGSPASSAGHEQGTPSQQTKQTPVKDDTKQNQGQQQQSGAVETKRLIIFYDRVTGGAQLFTHNFEKISKVQFRKRYEVLTPLQFPPLEDGSVFDASVLLAFDRSNGAGVIYQVTPGGEFRGLQKFVGWTQNWSTVCPLSDGRIMFHSQRGAYTECQKLVPSVQDVKRQPQPHGQHPGGDSRYVFRLQALWTVTDDVFDAVLPYTASNGDAFVLFCNRRSVDTLGRGEQGRITALTSDGALPVAGQPLSSRCELEFSWEAVITDGYGLLFFYDRRSAVSYTLRLTVGVGQAVQLQRLRSFPQTRISWQSYTFLSAPRDAPTVPLLLHDRDQAQAQVFTVDRATGKIELTRIIQHDTTTRIRFDYVNALEVNVPVEKDNESKGRTG